jgi:ferredoxin
MTTRQEQYIRDNILPGQVLRLFCQFTTPPKNKHLLLVGLEPTPLLFMVNSHIHPYVRSRAHLKSCQVLLKASEHFFLAHDSYVDCRNACNSFSLDDIIMQVYRDARRLKGFINEEAQEQVVAAVKACPVLEKHYQNLILAELAFEEAF